MEGILKRLTDELNSGKQELGHMHDYSQESILRIGRKQVAHKYYSPITECRVKYGDYYINKF